MQGLWLVHTVPHKSRQLEATTIIISASLVNTLAVVGRELTNKEPGYLWRAMLCRRSQGHHLPWRRIQRHIKRWFPPANVCHPYPLVRLGVLTQGGSRMR